MTNIHTDKKPAPLPKIVEKLLLMLLPEYEKYYLIGDHEEIYNEYLSDNSRMGASLWLWYQVLKLTVEFLMNRINWSFAMLKSYFKVAIRNLMKNKLHTAINILGLSIAFGCSILIFSFIRYEYNFDKFHDNADNIFEVYSTYIFEDSEASTSTQAPLGPVLADLFPEVISASRATRENLIVQYENKMFYETIIGADPEFFDVFTFPLAIGKQEKLIVDQNSVIINQEIVKKYFGDNDPVGKAIQIKLDGEYKDFTVAGVLDQIPDNSSIKPSFIINIKNIFKERLDEWGLNGGPALFIQLNYKEQALNLEKKFPATIDKNLHIGPLSEKSGYHLSSLTENHLNERFSPFLRSGSKKIYSYILSGIVALVLILAVINFVNITIGSSTPRVKEIGLRKVFGAYRRQLFRQFLFESILLSLIATLTGILLAVLFLPTFELISQKALNLEYLLNWKYLSGLIGLAMIIGLIAGSFPSIILSGFAAVDLFKTTFKITGKNRLSRIMIVFQFAISIFFVISTITISEQYNFMLNSKLGFDSDQVITLDLRNDSTNPDRNRAIYADLKGRLLQNNSILSLSASRSKYNMFSARGVKSLKGIVNLNMIDYNYVDFFGIELLEGRNFSIEQPSDAGGSVIVNKTFVDQFSIKSPVGRRISDFIPNMNDKIEIVGVVEDFHVNSLHNIIKPAYLQVYEDEGLSYIYIKIKADNITSTLSLIENEFFKIAPDIPFSYSFVDEEIAMKYESERRYGSMFSFVSFFAILIACSGLFGLTSLAVTKRTKEIGVRKVLGASIPGIMRLINTEFLILVTVGNIFAWPCAYFAAESWLQGFAYRIEITISAFIIAGIAAFIIAFITISFHSNKAARENPADSLRCE
jgi:putative ABC transport system permease protein